MNASTLITGWSRASFERRWNEKLERVAQLEQADAKAEADAQWDLTPAERTSITALSQDLPAIWAAPTTTNQDRKQLLRSAIDTVQLDGVSHVGQIEVQIRWRSGVITRLIVERYRRGADSLKTPVDAVERIHELTPMHTYAEIAALLNADGWRTAHGRSFTSQHVGYICRRDGLSRSTGNVRLTPKEDPQTIH